MSKRNFKNRIQYLRSGNPAPYASTRTDILLRGRIDLKNEEHFERNTDDDDDDKVKAKAKLNYYEHVCRKIIKIDQETLKPLVGSWIDPVRPTIISLSHCVKIQINKLENHTCLGVGVLEVRTCLNVVVVFIFLGQI